MLDKIIKSTITLKINNTKKQTKMVQMCDMKPRKEGQNMLKEVLIMSRVTAVRK